MTTLGERIIEALGGITSTQLKEATSAAAARAYEAGYADGNDDPASGQIASGGFGYRQISDKLRDFSNVSRDEASRVAWDLWSNSVIARRLLTLKRDHIIGRNTMPVAENSDLQEILDDFWRRNNLTRESSRFALQLFLFGEQCFPAAVRKSDGAAQMGYFDPDSIERVITHPENDLLPIAVVIKPSQNADEWVNASHRRVYRIIQRDRITVEKTDNGQIVRQPQYPNMLVTAEQANRGQWESEMLKAFGVDDYSGSAFFFSVNNVSNQVRGSSDLLTVADWIDQADETLFALAEREQFANYFSWFVNLGDTELNSDAWKAAVSYIRKNKPGKGSVNFHNNQLEWDMKTPDIKQGGSIETYRALLGLILGGLGFPVHWFGYGDDANKATAVAQASPTEKTLEHDQGIVRDMLSTILTFVRDQAIIAKKWTGTDDNVTIDLPEVSPRNMGTIAETMQKLAMALTAAEQGRWIDKETAAKAFAKLLGDLGIEVKPQEVIEDSDKKADDKTDLVKEYFRTNGGVYAR